MPARNVSTKRVYDPKPLTKIADSSQPGPSSRTVDERELRQLALQIERFTLDTASRADSLTILDTVDNGTATVERNRNGAEPPPDLVV